MNAMEWERYKGCEDSLFSFWEQHFEPKVVDAIPSDVNLENEGEGIEESMESGEAGAPVSPWRLRGDGMIMA